MSDCIQPCDPDCEAGPVHCIWLHLPRHKQGWHDQDDCPGSGEAAPVNAQAFVDGKVDAR